MEEKPIRVLQVLGNIAAGGVEAVIMNYYQHIDRSKVQFDFVVHKGAQPSYVEAVKSLGGRVYEITPYARNVFAYTYEIYSIIKNNKYQIVHSNMNALSCFPLFAAYLAGAKVRILHNHTTDSKAERLRTLIKHILRPFAKLFANEYWACSKLAGQWMYGAKAVEQGKVTIINNAIDLQKYAFNEEKRDQLRKELGLEGCFVVGHVGRFMKQKNHDFLVKIFAEVAQKNKEARLLLIGDGGLRKQVEAQVAALGLSEKVVFTGIRTDVADLYNAMDVFVLPSFYEGLPVVGVEAQMAALPSFFSTAVTAEAKLVDSTKYIALAAGAKVWADAICDIAGKLRELGKGIEQYDIRVQAKRLENCYKKLS